MVSFDAVSLSTNIPLKECIELVVIYIRESNPVLKTTAEKLKQFLN